MRIDIPETEREDDGLENVMDDHNHRYVGEVPGNVGTAIYREVIGNKLEPMPDEVAYSFTTCSMWGPELWIHRDGEHFYITTEEDE